VAVPVAVVAARVVLLRVGDAVGLQAAGTAEHTVHVLSRDGSIGGRVAVGAAGHGPKGRDEQIACGYNAEDARSIREFDEYEGSHRERRSRILEIFNILAGPL
jgi:hypothetical protein